MSRVVQIHGMEPPTTLSTPADTFKQVQQMLDKLSMHSEEGQHKELSKKPA